MGDVLSQDEMAPEDTLPQVPRCVFQDEVLKVR